MSTINTNVPSVTAQRQLSLAQTALARSLQHLASGLRINRGADDPAGLIVSERLRAEISTVNQAINNSARAINVIATTEAALDEVSAMLVDIKRLINEAANTGAFSDAERDANQLQIDSAIESITRIANTTSFAGRQLLNGELDYVTSGVDTASLANVNIQGAKFGQRDFIPVEVKVSQSALTAQLQFTDIPLPSAVSIDLAGPGGIVTLNFPASADAQNIADVINAQVDATGVSAVASATPSVVLNSREYGGDTFVSVRTVSDTGSFDVTDRLGQTVNRTQGRDAVATINGYQSVGNGLNLSVSSPLLKAELTLDVDFGTGTTNFVIVSGGALFQIGPEINSNHQENVGVKSIQANKLGSRVTGFLSELQNGQEFSLKNGKYKEANDIINEAITQVAVLRGRLGAFERNTLQPNINALQVASENLTASESVIRDTDFARETSELTRAQILVQAGNSILAIANAQSQNVLTLLGS